MNIYDKVKICIVTNFGAGTFRLSELVEKMGEDYPGVAEGSILPADYCVNKISNAGLSDDEYFLYWIDRGLYRIFDPQRDSRHQFPKR